MTPKQILDSFSETLMQDERILSAQERALVAHSAAACQGRQPARTRRSQEAVRAVIASAVGETVAQRAFAVLGGSIVERILESSALPLSDSAGARPPRFTLGRQIRNRPASYSGTRCSRASKEPLTARCSRTAERSAAAHARAGTAVGRRTRHAHSPLRIRRCLASQGSATAERSATRYAGTCAPERPTAADWYSTPRSFRKRALPSPNDRRSLPAQCVVLDEFLAPQELEELTRFTLEHEADFSTSEVVSPSEESGVVNYEHRRSRVLMDLGQHQDVMLERIKAVLPQVLEKLGMEEFSIAGVEAQITASNDGDFFHFHSDNGSDRVASRHLTFVYFFHREPRQFEGGELRIHDARLEDGDLRQRGQLPDDRSATEPDRLLPVRIDARDHPGECPSQLFADSRFTLNGWLRR